MSRTLVFLLLIITSFATGSALMFASLRPELNRVGKSDREILVCQTRLEVMEGTFNACLTRCTSIEVPQ